MFIHLWGWRPHLGNSGSATVLLCMNLNTYPILYQQHNVADLYPSIVETLLGRLGTYYDQTVYPYYPDFDPNAFPHNNEGAWQPWVESEQTKLSKQ